MRTSLIETEQIEHMLLGADDPGERLLTAAKVQLDPAMRDRTEWQGRTYQLIRIYGREKLRNEIQLVENKIFTQSTYRSFQRRIASIFK